MHDDYEGPDDDVAPSATDSAEVRDIKERADRAEARTAELERRLNAYGVIVDKLWWELRRTTPPTVDEIEAAQLDELNAAQTQGQAPVGA